MRGPWDPYNVTRGADLAFRLAMAGYQIGMLDSITYEEAPDTASVAKNQRSRWLQGFAQTGLVHTRHPLRRMRSTGPLRYPAFVPFMLGTPVSLLLNPLMWAATILYIVARLDALTAVSTFITGLFPTPVFYAGAFIAVAWNAVPFCQKPLLRCGSNSSPRQLFRRRAAPAGGLPAPAGIRPDGPAAVHPAVVGIYLCFGVPGAAQAAHPGRSGRRGTRHSTDTNSPRKPNSPALTGLPSPNRLAGQARARRAADAPATRPKVTQLA